MIRKALIVVVTILASAVLFQRDAASRTYHGLDIARDRAPELERFLEAAAGETLLDLVLLANTTQHSRLQRRVAGGWRSTQRAICVDFQFLFHDYARIPLERLGSQPPGLRSMSVISAPPIYGALRNTPARLAPLLHDSASPSARVTPAGLDYLADLAAAAKVMLGDLLQAEVEVRTMQDTGSGRPSECIQPDAVLVPRFYLELDAAAARNLTRSDFRDRFIRGEFRPVVELSVASFRIVRAARMEELQRQRGEQEAMRARVDAFVARLEQTERSGAQAYYGALAVQPAAGPRASVQQPARPCAVTPGGEDAPRWGMQLDSFMRSEPFRALVHGNSERLRGVADIDVLLSMLKQTSRHCSVAIGNGPQIAALYRALERDGLAARVSAFVSEAALAELHAQALGFTGIEGRTALQAWVFSGQIGGAAPAQVDALRGFGILDKPGYDAAMARYVTSGLGRETGADALLAFLNDEREARDRRISIGRLRAEREASTQRAAAQAEAASREAERRRAAEFPFIARISCTVGNTSTTVRGCMTGGGGRTELELRNGSEYRMYQIQDVNQAGREGPLGLEIDLRNTYALAIRNASDSLVLTVVVVRRSDGREMRRQSVSYRGLIEFHN